MSADERFLARWSRRKRGAATRRERPPAQGRAAGGRGTAGAAPEAGEPANLAGLPSIESIGAVSDIKAFLAPGVPANLMQAALRRAWSADPAIRDFVGLAENAWDFTAPGGVPGFGSLTADEAERLLTRLVGEPTEDEAASAAPEPSAAAQTAKLAEDRGDRTLREPCAEPRHESAARQSGPTPQRRRHGGALPE